MPGDRVVVVCKVDEGSSVGNLEESEREQRFLLILCVFFVPFNHVLSGAIFGKSRSAVKFWCVSSLTLMIVNATYLICTQAFPK